MESFPVQVSAIVRGHLANGCTVLDDILVEQVDDQFVLTAATHQEGDGCTETLVPFEETVSLPVRGLGVGTYRVAAGDVSAEFTFDVENAEAGAGSVEYISKLRGTVTEIVQGSDGIQVTLNSGDEAYSVTISVIQAEVFGRFEQIQEGAEVEVSGPIIPNMEPPLVVTERCWCWVPNRITCSISKAR